MDIKFVLLVIGIFIFTLGYVNQNKYNCNIIPSLDRLQEQDLKNLFYKDSEFLNYKRTMDDGTVYQNVGSRYLKQIINSDDDNLGVTESESTEYKDPNNVNPYGQ